MSFTFKVIHEKLNRCTCNTEITHHRTMNRLADSTDGIQLDALESLFKSSKVTADQSLILKHHRFIEDNARQTMTDVLNNW